MKLSSKQYGIKLNFNLVVTVDLDQDLEEIVYILAEDIKIRKRHEGFLIDEVEMEYVVADDQEMMEI